MRASWASILCSFLSAPPGPARGSALGQSHLLTSNGLNSCRGLVRRLLSWPAPRLLAGEVSSLAAAEDRRPNECLTASRMHHDGPCSISKPPAASARQRGDRVRLSQLPFSSSTDVLFAHRLLAYYSHDCCRSIFLNLLPRNIWD